MLLFPDVYYFITPGPTRYKDTKYSEISEVSKLCHLVTFQLVKLQADTS